MYFTVPSGFESYEFDNPCILHFFGGPIPREFNYNYIQCGNHFYVLLGSCWWLIGKQLGVKCSTVFFNLELPQIMRPLMYFPFPSGLESYEFDNSCKLHFFWRGQFLECVITTTSKFYLKKGGGYFSFHSSGGELICNFSR